MEQKPSTQKRLASISHPTVKAALKSLYRFASEEQARRQLAKISSHFITARTLTADDSAVIWVRGYEVTPEEEQQGYKGNFANIVCTPTED